MGLPEAHENGSHGALRPSWKDNLGQVAFNVHRLRSIATMRCFDLPERQGFADTIIDNWMKK